MSVIYKDTFIFCILFIITLTENADAEQEKFIREKEKQSKKS